MINKNKKTTSIDNNNFFKQKLQYTQALGKFFRNQNNQKILLGCFVVFGLILGSMLLFRANNNQSLNIAKASGYDVPVGVYQDAYTYENGFKDSGAGVTSTGFNHNAAGYYQAASNNASLESECISLPLPSGATFDGWQFLDFELTNRENPSPAQYNVKVTSCDNATIYSEMQNSLINADVKSLDIRPAGTNQIKIIFTTNSNTISNGVKIEYWKVVGKTTGATNITITTPVINADVTILAQRNIPFTINFSSNGAISHDTEVNVPMQDVNGLDTPNIDDGLAEDAEVDYGDGNGIKQRRPIQITSAANTNSGVAPSQSSFGNAGYTENLVWNLGNLSDGSAGSTQVNMAVPFAYFNGRKFAVRTNISFGYTPRESLGFDTKQKIAATSSQVTIKSIGTGDVISIRNSFEPDGAGENATVSVSTTAINTTARNNSQESGIGFASDREDATFTFTGNTGTCTPIYRGMRLPAPSYDYEVVSEPVIGTPFNVPIVVEAVRYSLNWEIFGPKFDILGSGCSEGQSVTQTINASFNAPTVSSYSASSNLLIQNNFTRKLVQSMNRIMYDGVVTNDYNLTNGEGFAAPAELVKPSEYIGYFLDGNGLGLADQTSKIDYTYSTLTIPNGLSFNGVRTKSYLDNLYKDCSGSSLLPDNSSFDFSDPTNSGWKGVNINWSGNPLNTAPDINNPNSVVSSGCRLLLRKDNDSPLNVNPDKGEFSAGMVFQVCDGTYCTQEANNVDMKVTDGKVYTRIGSINYGPTDYLSTTRYRDSVKIANGSYPIIIVSPVTGAVQGGTQASVIVSPGNFAFASEKVDARWVVNFFSIRDKVDLSTVSATTLDTASVPPGGNTSGIIFRAPNPALCLSAIDNNDVNCMAWWEVPQSTQPPTAWGAVPIPDLQYAGSNALYRFRLNVNLKSDLPAGTPVNFIGEVRGYNTGTGLPNSTLGGNNVFSGYNNYSSNGTGTPITVLDIPGVDLSKTAATIWPNNNTNLKYQLDIKNTGSAPNNGLYIVDKLPKNGVDNTTYEPQYRKIFTNYNSAQVIVEYSNTATCYSDIAGAAWIAMTTSNNTSEFPSGAVTDDDVPQSAFCTRVRLNSLSVVDPINSNESLKSNLFVLIENSAVNGSNVYNLSSGGAVANSFGQSAVSPVSASPVRTIIDNRVQIGGNKIAEIDPTRAGFVKWKLKYENTSGLPTGGITNIVDTLPTGLDFDSVVLPSPNPNGVSCVPVNCQPAGNILNLQISSIDAYDGATGGNDEGEILVWMKIPDAALDGASYQNCFDITSSAPNTQVQSGICSTIQKSTDLSVTKTQTFTPDRGLNSNSNQIVRPDDLITYTVSSANTESAGRYYRLYDQLDIGLNYVPGTLKINNVAQSDSLFALVSGKDTISHQFPILINPSSSVTLEFQAKVKGGLVNDYLIKNSSVVTRCSGINDINTCISAKDSNIVQAQAQDPKVITGSDITGSSCTPLSGVIGYNVNCTATFSNYKSGTIAFSTLPDTGTCTTPAIAPTDITASCSFTTTTIGNSIPVTATASGGGTATSGSITVLTDVSCSPSYSTVWVDDNFANPTPFADPDGVGNASSYTCDSFNTIQAGIDAVSSGGTVIVRAGNYSESLTINKLINLNGNNSTISPNSGTRAAESVISGGGTIAIAIGNREADIRGFSLDNVNISGGTDIQNLKFSKNIFSNLNKSAFNYNNINPGNIQSKDFNISDNLINPVTGGTNSAFVIWGVDGLTFTNNVILGSPWAGIQLDATPNNSIVSNTFSNTGEHAIQIANNSNNSLILNNSFTSLPSSSVTDSSVPVPAIRIYNSSTNISVITNNFSTVSRAIIAESSGPGQPQVLIDATNNNFGSNVLQDKEDKVNHNCTAARVTYPQQGSVSCGIQDNTASNSFLQVRLGISNITDTFLIAADKVSFNPTKINSKVFSKEVLTMTINGDSRFTQGGTTAICKIKIKNFGVADNDPAAGYGITQNKIDKAPVNTLGNAILLANQGAYSPGSSSFEIPYDSTNGCSVILPRLNQNQPKWDYEITVQRSDGQLYGRGESYFMLFGAIGVVSISV